MSAPPIPMPQPMPYPIFSSPTSVVFFWQPPTDPTGTPLNVTNYKFSLTDSISQILDAITISYEAKDLVHGTVYTPYVQASYDNGATWSENAYFPPFTPYNPPADSVVSASASPVSPGVAYITWVPPSTVPDGAPYFLVNSQSSNPLDPTIGFASPGFSTTDCTISELNPNSSYTFTVQICNQVGSSPFIQTNSISF